jgi:hypothetical protein
MCQTVSAVGDVIFGTHTSKGLGVTTAVAGTTNETTAPRNAMNMVDFMMLIVVERRRGC